MAYFVAPPAPSRSDGERSNYAMSKPAFDIERRIVWYSDVNSGLYGVRLTEDAWERRAPKVQVLPTRCASRRNFLIRLPRGLRRARVTVDGRRVRVQRRGARLRARVDLRGKPRKIVVVRVTGRTRSGRRVVQVRRYRTCTSRRQAR